MRHFYRVLVPALFYLLSPQGASGQIFAPEGVNLPGAWNGGPPGVQPFGGVQATAGTPDRRFLVETTLPTRRYHGVIKVAAMGADVAAGTYNWLFTSGPAGGYYNNKWSNVTVALNTVQTYTHQGATDNSVTLSNNRWYTVNMRDNGYANTQAAVWETASEPVLVTGVSLSPTIIGVGGTATITATVSASLPADQYVYLRYATNTGFSTNHNVVLMTGSGTTWSATIPGTYNLTGRTVSYFAFTANDNTLTAASSNLDLRALKFNNNNATGGYQYAVADNVTAPGATTWSTPASWVSGMVPASGSAVSIAHNLTLDQNAAVSSLTVAAGTFTVADGSARVLSTGLSGNVTVGSGAVVSMANGSLQTGTNGSLINNGTITGASGTIRIGTNGSLTNNGTFNPGTSVVQFMGTNAVNGSQNTTFYDVTAQSGGVNFGGAVTSTISNSLQINPGGFVDTNPPVYGASSTLIYATASSAAAPYGRGAEWSSATPGAKGYPANVQVGPNNTWLNLSNGAPGTARQCAGNLTIGAGSGLLLDFAADDMTQPLTVRGNLSISGTLSLSDAGGGDLKLLGNFARTAGGTFSPKGRAVFFDGTALQTIQGPVAGVVDFDYLITNNSSLGGVQLLSPVNVNATLGAALQLDGALDLNGNSLQLPNNTDLEVRNAARTITSSNGTGQLILRRNNTVSQFGGGSLIIDGSVRVITGGAGVGGIYFGGITTINGTLELQAGGFVDGTNNNGPLYGPASTVRYNIGSSYNRRSEWDGQTAARTPFNVVVTGNTSLNAFDPMASTGDVKVRGNLTIDAGSALDANNGTSPFEVQGNVSNAGDFTLSTDPGGDLKLGGNFVNTGAFMSNGRAVFFINNSSQTVQSNTPLAINYVVVEKGGGQVNLLSNLTVAAPNGGTALQFAGAGPNIFNINGQVLTLGALGGISNAGTIAANSGYTDTGVGTIVILGDGDFGTLRFTTGTTLGTLTLDRTGTSGGATLGSALRLSTALNLSQATTKLVLGADNLTLTAGATISTTDASRYIVTAGTGQVAREGMGVGGLLTAQLFPVGTATSYNPATLTNAGVLDTYRVRVSATSAYTPPFPARQIERFWTVDENTAGGANATLRLQWIGTGPQEQEGATFNRSKSLFFTENSGSGYTKIPATLVQVIDPFAAEASNITSFSEWSVGNESVLPVELLFFTGRMSGPDVLLAWQTASEKNNQLFDVERSLDGRVFERVGTLPGAGTTQLPQSYRFSDRNVARLNAALIYYRLRQLDDDGTTSFSTVVTIVPSQTSGTEPVIFPSVLTASDDFTLQCYAPTASTIGLILTDATGRVIYRARPAVAAGFNYLSARELPGYAGLSTGLYVAHIELPGQRPVQLKIVRQ